VSNIDTGASNDRMEIIQCAMNDVLDDGEDLTFENVAEYLQEEGMQIDAQEYRSASKLYFS
jgi:hypothetical protein